MKKKLLALIIAAIAAICCISFAACTNGGEITENDIVGTYELTSYTADGVETVNTAPKIILVFNEDGTGVETIKSLNQEYKFTWTLTDASVFVSMNGNEIMFEYRNGVLLIDSDMQGVAIHQEYTKLKVNDVTVGDNEGNTAITEEVIAGTYKITSYKEDGVEIIEEAPKVTMVFNADGTGVETIDLFPDEEWTFTWTLDGDTVVLTLDGGDTEVSCTYVEGKLLTGTVLNGKNITQEYTKITEDVE